MFLLVKFPAARCVDVVVVSLLLCVWVRLGLGCSGLMLCRSCGHEVAEDTDLRFVPSRLALSHRNDTVIAGKVVSVQLFENPQGFQFEVVTFKRADVLKHWPADSHFSWFPGHSWTVASCPRCKTHLGACSVFKDMYTVCIHLYKIFRINET